jgi:hypothetical protein
LLCQDFEAIQGEQLLKIGSRVKMLAESLLGENQQLYELISKRPAALHSQIPLSLRGKTLDSPLDLPLSYRRISDLQHYLIG